MEAGIERLTALAFIITGLSHIFAPLTWVRFFVRMREQGDVAGFLNGYVHMPLGLLILAFHPVWHGPGLLVTLIGCGLTLKGLIAFVWPNAALRSLARVSDEKAWEFRVAGLVLLVLGLIMGWIALESKGVSG